MDLPLKNDILPWRTIYRDVPITVNVQITGSGMKRKKNRGAVRASLSL